MTITRVGAATGSTTCTVPAHNIGDLILISAFRSGSTTAPALGAGFTLITIGTSANTCRPRLGYRIATATNDASGTWTNATALTCVVYTSNQIASGGSLFIGGFGIANAATNTLSYAAIPSMVHTNGTSWIAGFIGHKSTNQSLSSHAPTGMTFIASSDLVNTCEVCAYDTNGTVSAWTAKTVTVTGTAAGWDTQTVEIIENQAGSQITQLVQYLATTTNSITESGNAFKVNLPNPTLAGNLLVLCLSYAYSATRTITITDAANTWPGTPQVTNVDSLATVNQSILYIANANAGTQALTVTFDAAVTAFQANFLEFSGVATSSPGDGSSTANQILTTPAAAGAPQASGSFNTTADGDLILQFGSNTSGSQQYSTGSGLVSLASGSGMTPIIMDQVLGTAVQAQIQTTHGATNPNFFVFDNGASTNGYSSTTIAFKTSAGAGTPASTSGIRKVGVVAFRVTPAASIPIWLPTLGNLQVLLESRNELETLLNSMSDTTDGSWTVLINSGGGGYPQLAYHQNSTNPALGRRVTMNVTDLGAGEAVYLIYDVAGADPSAFDKTAYAKGSGTLTSIANAPSITPTNANGLVFATVYQQGLVVGVTAPSGAILDAVTYTGETSSSTMYDGNGFASFYNSTTSAENWTWPLASSAVISDWAAAAIAFKAASGASGSAAINLSILQAVKRAAYW